jgi:hypothetical protein
MDQEFVWVPGDRLPALVGLRRRWLFGGAFILSVALDEFCSPPALIGEATGTLFALLKRMISELLIDARDAPLVFRYPPHSRLVSLAAIALDRRTNCWTDRFSLVSPLILALFGYGSSVPSRGLPSTPSNCTASTDRTQRRAQPASSLKHSVVTHTPQLPLHLLRHFTAEVSPDPGAIPRCARPTRRACEPRALVDSRGPSRPDCHDLRGPAYARCSRIRRSHLYPNIPQ